MAGPQVPPGLGAPSPSDDAERLFDQPWCAPITSAEKVYDGAVWDIRRETFVYGDGQLRRDFMDHTGAVAVVAIDEHERMLVLRQYRHAVRLREWELPAGLLDVSAEPALICAQRELAEEADLVASDWQVLADYCTTPGGSNELVRVYLARGLSATDAPHPRESEEADMELRWVSLDDAHEAVLSGRVSNSIIVVAVLTAVAKRNAGWSHLLPGNAPWPMLEWRNASA